MEEKDIYKYRPLERKDHIRILEILSKNDDKDVIRCQLHHESYFSPVNPYIAISYVWGVDDPSKRRTIFCEDRKLSITPNLHCVLIKIRDLGLGQFCWVDALCINQATDRQALEERSSQVQLMNQIFSQAQRVVIDLGQLADEHMTALDLVDRCQAIPAGVWSKFMPTTAESTPIETALAYLSSYNLDPSGSVIWPFVHKFLLRPWFSRIWVIQEFVLARQVTFLIGNKLRDEYFLRDGIMRLFAYMTRLSLVNSTSDNGQRPVPGFSLAFESLFEQTGNVGLITRLRYSDGFDRTFKDLITLSIADFDATNIRDKVYAILGMVLNYEPRSNFNIDYTERLPDFMLRIGRYLVDHELGTFLLNNCSGCSENSGNPSWTIRLDGLKEDFLASRVAPDGSSRDDLFLACGQQKALKCRLSPNSRSNLLLTCSFLDTVDCMTTSLPDHKRWRQGQTVDLLGWFKPTYHWTKDNFERYRLSHPLHTEEDFRHDCWRTVIADSLRASNRGVDTWFERLGRFETAERCISSHDYLVRVYFGEFSQDGPMHFEKRDDYILIEDELNYRRSLNFLFGRRLCLTEKKGLLCLVPGDTEVGDRVVIVPGCILPFVIRESPDCFRIVGPCYVHNMMDGQALEQDNWNEVEIIIG